MAAPGFGKWGKAVGVATAKHVGQLFFINAGLVKGPNWGTGIQWGGHGLLWPPCGAATDRNRISCLVWRTFCLEDSSFEHFVTCIF